MTNLYNKFSRINFFFAPVNLRLHHVTSRLQKVNNALRISNAARQHKFGPYKKEGNYLPSWATFSFLSDIFHGFTRLLSNIKLSCYCRQSAHTHTHTHTHKNLLMCFIHNKKRQ